MVVALRAAHFPTRGKSTLPLPLGFVVVLRVAHFPTRGKSSLPLLLPPPQPPSPLPLPLLLLLLRLLALLGWSALLQACTCLSHQG